MKKQFLLFLSPSPFSWLRSGGSTSDFIVFFMFSKKIKKNMKNFFSPPTNGLSCIQVQARRRPSTHILEWVKEIWIFLPMMYWPWR